jgi:NADH dehydrogenase
MGKRRVFLRAPIAFHYGLAKVSERFMRVPLIARAQVRMLQEEFVEPARAPDELPADLVPTVAFDDDAIRRGLPSRLERFGRADLLRKSGGTFAG